MAEDKFKKERKKKISGGDESEKPDKVPIRLSLRSLWRSMRDTLTGIYYELENIDSINKLLTDYDLMDYRAPACGPVCTMQSVQNI